MLTRSKLLFAALAAAAMMLTLVANASARNLSVSESEFEVLFRGLTFEAAGNNITCPITLLGHFFERTIPKSLNSNIGVIRHVSPLFGTEPPCERGTITVLNETLPWRVTYQGFSGTLPHISAIRLLLVGVAFQVRNASGTVCLAGTTTRNPAAGEALVEASGGITGLRADERVGIPLGGGFSCGFGTVESHFIGTGTVLNLPGTAAVTVTLI